MLCMKMSRVFITMAFPFALSHQTDWFVLDVSIGAFVTPTKSTWEMVKFVHVSQTYFKDKMPFQTLYVISL